MYNSVIHVSHSPKLYSTHSSSLLGWRRQKGDAQCCVITFPPYLSSSRGSHAAVTDQVVEVVPHGRRPEEVEVAKVPRRYLGHGHGRAVLQLGG